MFKGVTNGLNMELSLKTPIEVLGLRIYEMYALNILHVHHFSLRMH